MIMKKLLQVLVTCLASVVFTLGLYHGALTKDTDGLTKTPSAEKTGEALLIDTKAKMSSAHPQFQLDMTCAECHPIKCDALSSATAFYLNSFTTLKKEEVWKRIVAFLPGRERFVLATSYRNKPTSTTIDFVLDPVEKVSYAVSEKGTQKLEQIKENPVVSMVHYEGWTVAQGGEKQWKSVQIEGRAEVIPSSDPRFEAYLDTYQLVRLSKERAKKRMDILKVTIDKVMLFDSTLLKSGGSLYQMWERG